MKIVRFLVRVLVLAMVFAAFAGWPVCWTALRAQSVLWGAVATLLLGRFFCEAICPLGIVQSLVNWICHPKTHVRRVCSRLPETKAQRIVRWSIVAVCVVLGACGCMGPAKLLVPISIFGKAVALWTPGLVLFGVVVVKERSFREIIIADIRRFVISEETLAALAVAKLKLHI